MPTALSRPAPARAAAAHHGADQVGPALGRRPRRRRRSSTVRISSVLTTSSSRPSSTTTRFEPPPSTRCGHAELAAEPQRLPQLVRRAREGHHRGRAAHAHGGVARRGSLLAERARRLRAGPPSFGGSMGSTPRLSRLWAPGLRRSSSPAVHTLPAPRVSTTSPSLRLGREPLRRRLEVARVGRLAVPALGDGAGQRLGGDSRDRLLARRRRCRSASSTSAWWKARQKSSHSALRCACSGGAGRAPRVRRAPARRRSASRVARISVGWWP